MTQTARALLCAPIRYPPRRDLESANRITYVLHQRFVYTYDAPVRDLDHRLVVVPPQRHGDQRRRLHSVTVSAEGARIASRRDGAGNTVTRVRVPRVPGRVEFMLAAVVERAGPEAGAALPATALTDPRWLQPTRLTAADPVIRDLAAHGPHLLTVLSMKSPPGLIPCECAFGPGRHGHRRPTGLLGQAPRSADTR